jgi:signal recognition particle GTPase
VTVTDVNQLLKQFAQARKMMKQVMSQQGKRRGKLGMPGGGFPGAF